MNYKAGWLIQEKVMALTHFEPVVTPEDFQGIINDTVKALNEVTQEYHMLIDNRIIADTSVISLDTMLQILPIINHPQLRWIVVVLPESLKDSEAHQEVEQHGLIQLKRFTSLDDAYQHLSAVDKTVDWSTQNNLFFVNTAIN